MNPPRNGGPAIRRRGFLVLGGAGVAAVAVSACGTEAEEPNDERDIEILAEALVGEENAAGALKVAREQASGSELETVRALAGAADANATRLQDLLSDLKATPEGEFKRFTTSDLEESLHAATEETNRAVAAYARGAGQLTEELRGDALELIVADGARLAVIAELLGTEPAPFAFVTGLDEKPHQTIDADDDDDGEKTTTTTTDETTSTTEDGS
jgi:hypothetical protein